MNEEIFKKTLDICVNKTKEKIEKKNKKKMELKERELKKRNPNGFILLKIPKIDPEKITELFHYKGEKLPFLYPLTMTISLKKSTVEGAGNGLFAKKNIKKGQVITLYPCHLLYQNRRGTTINMENILEYARKDIKLDQKSVREYSAGIELNDYKDYAVYGNPKILDNHSLGHMINDCISEKILNKIKNLTKKSSAHKCLKCKLEYWLNAEKKANCNICTHNNITYIRSTKNIEEGEELFNIYGPVYWVDGNVQQDFLKKIDSINDHRKKTVNKIRQRLGYAIQEKKETKEETKKETTEEIETIDI